MGSGCCGSAKAVHPEGAGSNGKKANNAQSTGTYDLVPERKSQGSVASRQDSKHSELSKHSETVTDVTDDATFVVCSQGSQSAEESQGSKERPSPLRQGSSASQPSGPIAAVIRGEGRGVQMPEKHLEKNTSFPKRPLGCRLSKELWDKLEHMFSAMDTDGSNFVSKEEAKDFFKGAFSNISADAMFAEIDVDHSGAITSDEFMNFWVQVKKSGYSDEDISEEIDNLLEGNAWVDWKDERSTEKAKVEEFPKRKWLSRVSRKTWQKCEDLFREIDQDGSMQITRPKALKHFKGAFSKVSTEAMFNEVDTKGHGTITPKDFMNFWVQVRNAGYTDKDLQEEIEMIMEGEPWRDWKDGRTT